MHQEGLWEAALQKRTWVNWCTIELTINQQSFLMTKQPPGFHKEKLTDA